MGDFWGFLFLFFKFHSICGTEEFENDSVPLSSHLSFLLCYYILGLNFFEQGRKNWETVKLKTFRKKKTFGVKIKTGTTLPKQVFTHLEPWALLPKTQEAVLFNFFSFFCFKQLKNLFANLLIYAFTHLFFLCVWWGSEMLYWLQHTF